MVRYYKKILFAIIMIFIFFSLYIVAKNFSSNTTEENTEQNINDEIPLETFSYKNPIIPDGFHAVETSSASWTLENGVPKGWNNGLVIADSLGNEFVWVPVANKEYIFTSNEYNYLMDTENQDEIQQIDKYNGFYISRYEAGISDEILNSSSTYSEITNDVTGMPLSQPNKIVWNYISLKNAKINATNMYNSQNIHSDLLTTRQYLRVIEWFYSTNNIKDIQQHSNFSNTFFTFSGLYSNNKGQNYQFGDNVMKNDNLILSTGCTDRNSINNIYDFFGNVAEYTDGYVKDRGYYSAGGYFDHPFEEEDCTFLRLLGVSPLYRIGFRIVLYLV